VTTAALAALLVAAFVVRAASAILWVASRRLRGRFSTSEVGYLVAGLSCLLWVILGGADPVLASLTAATVGLAASGIGPTIARGG